MALPERRGRSEQLRARRRLAEQQRIGFLRLPSAPRRRTLRYYRRTWRQYFQLLGPSIITGAADNDPAGVITYTQVGATTGFRLLWLMVLATPMLFFLEEMAMRLAVVTKQGLARNIRRRFGANIAIAITLVFVISNVTTIGADLAGMAAALQVLTGIPWEWMVAPLTGVLGYVVIVGKYQQLNRFLFILTPLFLLYIATGIAIRPPWEEVIFHTFVPQLESSTDFIVAALALLGATLTPYMFFWETAEMIEERRRVEDLAGENLDVAAGMAYANLIFYFIVLVAGATFFERQVKVETVADAALALRPLAGDLVFTLFAIAMVISGLMAVPVMAASTAYAVVEATGLVRGFRPQVWRVGSFYIVLLAALALGGVVALLGIEPAQLIFWSQAVNGLLLPLVFVVLLLLTNDTRIMRRYTNGLLSNAVGWGTVALSSLLGILMLWDLTVRLVK